MAIFSSKVFLSVLAAVSRETGSLYLYLVSHFGQSTIHASKIYLKVLLDISSPVVSFCGFPFFIFPGGVLRF